MNILYVSTLCSKNKFDDLFRKSKVKPAQQAQKYHRLMVEGLAGQKETSITVLSSVPTNRSISSQIYYRSEIEIENGVQFRYLPFINYLVVRQVFLFITCFYYSLKWCSKHKKGTVICDVLNITVASAALLASKLTKTSSIGIVTDVPVFLTSMTTGKTSIRGKLTSMINTFIMNRFDSYVFLTQFMNDLINKSQKPYVVIEGQVDVNMTNTKNTLCGKYEKKICMYTGAIYRIYGIKLLTDAFLAADIEDAELHIYGSGDFEDELKEICLNHSNIKYYGVVSNDIVVEEQVKATLLINPRPTNEEYTKYSFPSKNMEYMVSGTPVLTTCLPGMPEEYKKYVYLIEDETLAGSSRKLKEVLSKPREELHKKGQDAKLFVLGNKNNVVQAEKIMQMIRKK